MSEAEELVKPKNSDKVSSIENGKWQTVCQEADISPDTGVCALVRDQQVAVFRLRKGSAVYAISNHDPIGQANVLSRGIVGSLGERIVVASPLYKQHFDLKTGECLEDGTYSVASFPVRVVDEEIQVAIPAGS
ncbi:nitrite reductase small subunit NirD [Gilvimarinus sp. F26214L]|uniref:nitrite reductase small subunit NirD n=1 Tax=Gilvimarinus sp. DZF01 TaxID=3461371 RepID=UPI0040461C8A